QIGPANRHAVLVPHEWPAITGGLAVAGADPPVTVRAAVDGVEYLHQVVHRDADLIRGGDESTRADIPPLRVGRPLEQLQLVKSLELRGVKVVEIFGEDQVEILVAPPEMADIWGFAVEPVLELAIVVIGPIRRHLLE